MSKPNMHCGECPYWLAYGEPETTDEMNQAIEEHCAKCELDFDPEAADYLDRMMRAARQQFIWRKAIHEKEI
jgi:predicted metal-binding protein